MKERAAHCINGLVPMLAFLALIIIGAAGELYVPLLLNAKWAIVPLIILTIVFLKGFFVVAPNEATILTFFGNYIGTVLRSGFWFVNPLASRKSISLKVSNFQSPQLKVNDAHGNPIEIASVIVWKVVDTAAAVFNVEDYHQFMQIQSETALRHLANHYPYEPHAAGEIALRSHPEEVGEKLLGEVQQRVGIAGIEVIQTQLSHLAYSPEIAQAMLRRQQAQAVIAARQMIVDGAVSMVEMAIRKLETDNILHLDEAAKSIMVNNLMVTLVSEHHVQPVLSTTR